MRVEASSWSLSRDETAINPAALQKAFLLSRGLSGGDGYTQVSEGSAIRGTKRKAGVQSAEPRLENEPLEEASRNGHQSVDFTPEAEASLMDEDTFQLHNAKIKLSINPRTTLLDREGH